MIQTFIIALIAHAASFIAPTHPAATIGTQLPGSAPMPVSSRWTPLARFVPPFAGPRLAPDGEGFRIQLPDGFTDPEPSTVPISTSGGELPMHVYTATEGTVGIAMVAWVDYPDASFAGGIPIMLDGAERGAMKNLNGKVITRQEVTRNGNPGRTLTFSGKSGGTPVFGRIDYFLAKPRLYQVLYLSSKKANLKRSEIAAMFASLVLAEGDGGTATAGSGTNERVQSDEGGYTLALPSGFAKPNRSTTPVETAAGTIDMVTYLSIGSSGDAMMAAHVDYPEGALSGGMTAMLDGAEEGAMKNLKGKVIARKSVDLNGYPGRSITFQGMSGTTKVYGRADYYLIGQRMYQIIFLSQSKTALTNREIDASFASFRLTK